MSNKQADFLISVRDGALKIADAASDLLKSMAPPELGLDKEPVAVQELNFNLKYDAFNGAQLGDYEVAYKTANPEDKFTRAYTILKNNNATIKGRYHGEGYQHSYWLYGEGKIYRQKLKPKA
jgi:hypothetical protein